MNTLKTYSKQLLILGLLIGVSAIGAALGKTYQNRLASRGDEYRVNYANPAATYCKDLGYTYNTRNTKAGDVGVCIFPNGERCQAWDFLTGTCGEKHSFCARQGMKQETRSDGNNPYSEVYAVCTDKQGKVIDSVVKLARLEEKATEGCGSGKTVEFETDEDEPFLGDVAPALPGSFDWRAVGGKNYLPPVRDQGDCGSCWAHGATGILEAQLNIINNTAGSQSFNNLSEEYLVSDCLSSGTCCGGNDANALAYIKSDGIPDETCMKYVDGTGCSCSGGTCDSTCTYSSGSSCSDRQCSNRCSNWSPRLIRVNAYGKVSSSRDAIKQALITKGPLSADLRMAGTYTNNVYKCTTDTPVDHTVIIVGYNDTTSSWIIRNSWGTNPPGNDGYFNVGYGECGIESQVYYAKLTDLDYPFSPISFSTAGWASIKGTWNMNGWSTSYNSTGIANGYGSAAYRGVYSNGTFVARLKRTGTCTGCANAIIIRGDSTKVTSDGYWDDYYTFQYVNDGSYSIWKRVNGVSTALAGWTSHSAIVKNGWNTLKIVTTNGAPTQMKFYINNTLVATITDSSLKRGRIGFRIYREAEAGTLSVDSASYTIPPHPASADILSASGEEYVVEGTLLEGGTEMMSP